MVADPQMTVQTDIHTACDELKTPAPKVIEYANCITASFRNGDGLKILVMFPLDASADTIRHKIAGAFKIKAGNEATDETMAKVFSPPTPPDSPYGYDHTEDTPAVDEQPKPEKKITRKQVQDYQEAKKTKE